MTNRVENIVAKGEIAHYEKFFMYHNVFQKLSAVNTSKSLAKGNGYFCNAIINPFPHIDAF